MPPEAVLLFEDETILRLFPVLRRAWSLRGEQAIVPITGHNAKRVLFGTINPQTGHRIVLRRANMRQESYQDFLRLLRQSYPGREIWLLLDEAPCHIAPKSQALAAALHIELVWLPKQCSELNALDQLGRGLKMTSPLITNSTILMNTQPVLKPGSFRSPGARLFSKLASVQSTFG